MVKPATPAPSFLITLPEPRDIVLTGGMAELSEDVRLVTFNVAPLYRKTMRTVLAAAGIRVVANKKKFIIDVRVDKAETFSFKDVPAAARDEYCEVEVQGNALTIRTASQIGALWGSHTIAGIYRARSRGIAIPNLRIRDWPDARFRGAFVRSLWGLDRMVPEEWMYLFERLAGVKLNAVGIPVDGGRSAAAPETVSAGLLVPFAGQDACQREVQISWYSPALKTWRTDTCLPRFHGENVLALLLGMARENGLTPFPVISGLGERTALPRLLPAISALGADGKPAGEAFCLSAPETRTLLAAFYTGLLPGFAVPDTQPLGFLVQLGLPPGATLDRKGAGGWCACAKCRKKTPAQLVQEHLLWLGRLLHERGVQRLMIADELPAVLREAVFTPEFARQLDKAGLLSLVALARRDAGQDKKKNTAPWSCFAQPDIAVCGWVPDDTAKVVEGCVVNGLRNGRSGTLLETAWDGIALGPLETFATASWRAALPDTPRTPADMLLLHMTKDHPSYCDAYQTVQKALAAAPTARPWLRSPTGLRLFQLGTDGSYDLAPALAALAPEARKLVPELLTLSTTVAKAHHFLHGLLEQEEKPENMEMFRALNCETARLIAAAHFLVFALELWDGAARRKLDPRSVKACEALRGTLLDSLTAIENRRTKLTGPLKLSDLAPLFGLTEQLLAQVHEVAAGKRKPDALSWSWKPPPPPVA